MQGFTIFMTALAALALAAAAGAADAPAEPPLRLELDLVDGSRMVGTPRMESVSVETPYARMDVPLQRVLSISLSADHATAALELRNGDRLKGVLGRRPITLATAYGRVSVEIAHIAHLRILRSGDGALRAGLILHYTFDDADYAASASFRDSAGQGPPLRARNGRVTQAEGVRGLAASFSQGVLTCDTNPTAKLAAFTLALWFKTPNPGADLKLASAAWWRGGSAASGWNMGTWYSECWADQQKPMFVAGRSVQHQAKRVFEPNAWNHLAITCDRTAYREYLNGQLFRSEVCTGATVGDGTPLMLGGWMGSFQFRGELDEFRVYNRALSADDVRDLHAGRW